MYINQQGWLDQAKQKPSPNYDQRPENTTVNLLVIHNISLPPGQYGGNQVVEFFQNQLDPQAHPYFEAIANVKVSAHLFIRRSGEIIQLVSFDERAWHAGVSCFERETACNNYSIGIELEGCDDEAYESPQYKSLIAVSKALQQHYPAITHQRIVGHEDIAPGRKTDPGPAFDWQYYLSELQDVTNAETAPLALPKADRPSSNPHY